MDLSNVLYSGTNAVYVSSGQIVSLDKLFEMQEMYPEAQICVEDSDGFTPCRLIREYDRSADIDAHVVDFWHMVIASGFPVSEDPNIFKKSRREFGGFSLGKYYLSNTEADISFGYFIGYIVIYGTIEDECIRYPYGGSPFRPEVLGITDYTIIDHEYGREVEIYDKEFYDLCTRVLKIDTNQYTKTMPETVLQYSEDFARGLLLTPMMDKLGVLKKYPHRLVSQIGVIADAVGAALPNVPTGYPVAYKMESPRGDYYRVLTESGTFVTNSVLCIGKG